MSESMGVFASMQHQAIGRCTRSNATDAIRQVVRLCCSKQFYFVRVP